MRLQLSGLDIGREVVAQIEAQTHCVKDRDLPFFADALQVNLHDLFLTNGNGRCSIASVIAQLQNVELSRHAQKVVMKSLQPA